MSVLPQITGGQRIALMYALLAVAAGGAGAGIYSGDLWWLAVVGVLALLGFGWLSNEPASRRVHRSVQGVNPSSGSAIIPDTQTDSQGNYYGSTGR